ncbi:MAG: iron ABC transporter permease, partial [Bacteroidota bacterium]|nr:iron ABC transporter permease [Bacteroidota bacterium]
MLRKNKYIIFILLLITVIAFCFDILLGSVSIPIGEALKIATGSTKANPTWVTIITEFRIPKAITAILAGSALSVCGLLMQTFFRNPLADPYVLGISSGASLGVALVILTTGTIGGKLFIIGSIIGRISITVAAGIGAAAVLFIITAFSKRISSNVTLLILGLMLGYIISSIESVLKYFSAPENLQGYIVWGMGNFGNVIWQDLVLLIPVVLVGLLSAFLLSKQLNLLLLGESYASSMGANIKLTRLLIIIIAGILGGIITAFCGPIAFIGIAVPHLTKSIFNKYDHLLL